MALIGTIRNNTWVLVPLLGLGLLAFILMDLTSGAGRNVASDFVLGSVNGEPIDYREFRNLEETLYNGTGADNNEVKNYLWNYFVEKEIVEEEARALGLTVGRDELMELQFGQNLSPVVSSRFMNQQTRQVDRQQLNNIKQQIESGQIDERLKPFWAAQEREIIKAQLQSKINTLVTNGIYTPSWMVEEIGKLETASAKVAYVSIPFSEIDDTQVSLTEEDYSQYISDHAKEYTYDKEMRKGSFFTISVVATKEDSLNIKKKVADLMPRFMAAEDDSLFAITNKGYYSSIYQTKDELGKNVPDALYDLAIDSTYGPILMNGAYVAYKMLGKKIVPDSIQARHILISASPENPQSYKEAQARIDSLKTVIGSGANDFETLANEFGQDATNTKGGDLGTFGKNRMVQPFNDLVFYEAEKGKLYTVRTQFGVHLVEVMRRVIKNNQQGILFSLIQEPIVPSIETQESQNNKAIEMITSNATATELKEDAKQKGMQLNETQLLDNAAYRVQKINSTTVGRALVKWLFEKDDINAVYPDVLTVQHPNLRYDQTYIIATRDKIVPAGIATVDEIKEIITPEVMKVKKGEMIKNAIGNASSLSSLASQYSVDVDTIENLRFSSSSVVGLGSEPELIGAIYSASPNQIGGPIVGNNGVYVFSVLSKSEGTIPENMGSIRKTISRQLAQQVNTALMPAMKEKSEIEDNRFKFF